MLRVALVSDAPDVPPPASFMAHDLYSAALNARVTGKSLYSGGSSASGCRAGTSDAETAGEGRRDVGLGVRVVDDIRAMSGVVALS
jgi:hypothetical protein